MTTVDKLPPGSISFSVGRAEPRTQLWLLGRHLVRPRALLGYGFIALSVCGAFAVDEPPWFIGIAAAVVVAGAVLIIMAMLVYNVLRTSVVSTRLVFSKQGIEEWRGEYRFDREWSWIVRFEVMPGGVLLSFKQDPVKRFDSLGDAALTSFLVPYQDLAKESIARQLVEMLRYHVGHTAG